MDILVTLISVFSCIVILTYIILIVRYTIGWKQLEPFLFDPSIIPKLRTTVSIIIAARNEEENILNLLNAIVLQKYNTSLFEIILVDDHSEDRTVEFVEEFINKHPECSIQLAQLKIINPKLQNKKAAINEGIKVSKNELIVTTDADCVMNENWLCSMVAYYESYHPKMIAAPVLLNGNSFFQQLQQLEFLSLMGTTAAAIRIGKPLMCNGANLAYARKVFDEVGGIESNSNISTGDDTFLMFEIWKKYKNGIHFLKSNNAVVTTNAKQCISDFLQQRIRWASKTNQYKVNHVFRVGYLLIITNMIFMMLGIATIFQVKLIFLLVVLFLFKFIFDFFILSSVAMFFNKRYLLNASILLTLAVFYPIYILVIGISSQSGFYKWKGRESTRNKQ